MGKPLGFTVIELLVALAIASVLIGLAIPAFKGYVERNRSGVAVNQMIANLQSARFAAITLRTPITICPSANGNDCGPRDTWHLGTLIFADANRNGRRDPGEEVLRVLPGFDERARWYWRSFRNRTYLSFTPTGLTQWQNGTLLYCPPGGDATLFRALIINPPGRVRRATDADGDGIVDDASGRSVTCP